MRAALRYVASLVALTTYHSLRMVWHGLRGSPFQPGGGHDQIPRDYARALLRANGLTTSAHGLERVEGLGACVYVVNHQSWMDILAVLDVLPGSLHFLAKQELGWVPLFGQALRAAGYVEIDRGNLPKALGSYERALRAVQSGRRPVLFPEGTRSRDGRLLPFKKGPFVLAITAQVPVVPVCLEGPFEVLPKGSLRPCLRPMIVRVGAPIPTTGLTYDDRDALSARCREAILALGARA